VRAKKAEVGRVLDGSFGPCGERTRGGGSQLGAPHGGEGGGWGGGGRLHSARSSGGPRWSAVVGHSGGGCQSGKKGTVGGGRSVGGERGACGPAAGLVVLGRPGEEEPL
jgi:hypothetical protein